MPENIQLIVSNSFEKLKDSNVGSFRGIGFYWMTQRLMCNLFPVLQDGTLDTETNRGGYGKLQPCRSAAAVLKDAIPQNDGTEVLPLYSKLRKQIDKLQEEAHGLKQTVEGLEVRLAEAREEVTVAHSATDAAEEERKTARADAARAQAKIDRMLAATRHPSAVLIDPRAFDVTRLDLDSARASLAGPDSVYITSIEYDGLSYSALLKYRGGTTATVEQVFGPRRKLIPDSVGLFQTELAFEEPDVLSVSYVDVDGQGFSGKLRYAGANRLEVAGIRRVTLPLTAADRISALQGKLAATEDALAHTQTAAAAQLEMAATDQAVAAEQIAALQAELTRMQTVIERLQASMRPAAPFSPERNREPLNSDADYP